MKCEYFEGCPVYTNAGEAACRRHFCNDTCPDLSGENHGVLPVNESGVPGKKPGRTGLRRDNLPNGGKRKC
ncbi:MAG: hypothetical protein AB9919_06895 [Geobacteraceae bacterium]